MTEAELESYILSSKGKKGNNARFILGKMMMEGTNPSVSHNEVKGLNWLKEPLKAGH